MVGHLDWMERREQSNNKCGEYSTLRIHTGWRDDDDDGILWRFDYISLSHILKRIEYNHVFDLHIIKCEMRSTMRFWFFFSSLQCCSHFRCRYESYLILLFICWLVRSVGRSSTQLNSMRCDYCWINSSKQLVFKWPITATSFCQLVEWKCIGAQNTEWIEREHETMATQRKMERETCTLCFFWFFVCRILAAAPFNELFIVWIT